MKIKLNWKFNVVFILFFICLNGYAQKGSIKIYSELKGVNVYLDEVFKGTDINSIDSVTAGNHYLKVVKDDVIVFGELVVAKPNETTAILVKETKDIQDKMLAKKYNEQESYRSKKLDVLLDTKYVTETSGNTQINEKTKSLYFPGYFSVLGGSNTTGNVSTNSTTVTKTETSWFIIRGNQKISHDEFAQLTNNTDYFNKAKLYNSEVEKYEQIKKQKPKWKVEATPLIIGAVFAAGGYLLYDPKVNMFSTNTSDAKVLGNAVGGSLMLVGTVAFLTGLFHHERPNNPMPVFISPITMDDAIRDSKEYNRKLKIELGLPENYEPQK
ncbi:MAG: hypothetical protein P4L34_06720 [Paludibacter sp.]|nr:hypothetical protein [Paludibacter sp.]